ncbi:homologous-pairing protein 2 homolog isoform X1 [Melanaphis sacchari]|uniref:homologous-pairing protein 2 homolog isoform X1 n=1 Tax=Melanaphis sacchari TaxID=742174 RepID=UPI000DC142CA|nr:homologous-pairing protein 2 homolog isoform X1 [Melanaphis sacchari]
MGSDKKIVYDFMATANRPFSGNDVFSNLQRQGVGKSAVEKALDQLVKENKIFMKLNGKQKIYCVVQPDSTAEDQNEIQSIDEELVKVTETLREVERKYKQSEIEVKTLQNTYSTEEVKRKVSEMEKVVSDLKSQLDVVSKTSGNVVSSKDREKVKKEYETMTKEYRKRKRMCTDILDSILENCPKPKKALFEEIGIETDESVGMPAL